MAAKEGREKDYPDKWESPEDDSMDPYNNSEDIDMDEKLINSGFVTPAKDNLKPQKGSWEEVDELCPNCGKVMVEAKGFNKQNLKRLFSFQTDVQSLTIMFLMIVCGIFAFMTYSYMTTPINCSANITDIVANERLSQMPNPQLNISLCSGNTTCQMSNYTVPNLAEFVVDANQT